MAYAIDNKYSYIYLEKGKVFSRVQDHTGKIDNTFIAINLHEFETCNYFSIPYEKLEDEKCT